MFESQNYSVAGEKYKQECNVYASKAITKIANILSFGEKSLGQSQEFIAITSGMIANENFISLITNVGWESIYHYFEGVDGSKAGALKDKARRLLKG